MKHQLYKTFSLFLFLFIFFAVKKSFSQSSTVTITSNPQTQWQGVWSSYGGIIGHTTYFQTDGKEVSYVYSSGGYTQDDKETRYRFDHPTFVNSKIQKIVLRNFEKLFDGSTGGAFAMVSFP